LKFSLGWSLICLPQITAIITLTMGIKPTNPYFTTITTSNCLASLIKYRYHIVLPWKKFTSPLDHRLVVNKAINHTFSGVWTQLKFPSQPYIHCVNWTHQLHFHNHSLLQSTCKVNKVWVSIQFTTGTLHKSVGEYLGCKQIQNMDFRSLVKIEICSATCYCTPQTSSNSIVTLIQHWYSLIVLDIKFTSSLQCSLVVTKASNFLIFRISKSDRMEFHIFKGHH